MLVGELERVDQTEGFLDAPPNWQIIHNHAPQFAIPINDEQASAKPALW